MNLLELLRRRAYLGWLVVAVVMVSLPQVGVTLTNLRQIVLICIMALAVSGLNLVYGFAGELTLGQAAIYAGGAYTTGYLASNGYNDLFVTLTASVVVGLVIGVVTGVPGLRMGGWMLAIMSFFLVILIPSVINIIGTPLGGFSGLTGIPRVKVLGHQLTDNGYYIAVVLVTLVWFVILRNVVRSRHGVALLTLKESPILASSLGMSPYAMKLKAYALSSIPAALAGSLFAYLDGFIAPESFGLSLSITLLAASILGGTVTIIGAIVGSAIIILGPGNNSTFQEYSLIAYGAFLVIGGVVFNDGIVGLVNKLWRRYVKRTPVEAAATAAVVDTTLDLGTIAGKRLVLRGVGKSFGGVAAVDDVDLVAEPGQVTALIGPNGSGKTTTLNLISGYYSADQGEIMLGDVSLRGRPVHRVSRAGVGRTFQTPMLPPELTVRQVVSAASFDRRRSSFVESALRLPRFFSTRRSDEDGARLLKTVGLSSVIDAQASSLALGTRRMVELVRAVAGGNGLILLDEVAAGLDEIELGELARIIIALRDAGATVVLVEHNFAFVSAIADRVCVLAEGSVLSVGTVAEVTSDPKVLSSYLGEGTGVTGTRVRDAIDVEVHS
jgi:branched-chain amino acid transport system permease protein